MKHKTFYSPVGQQSKLTGSRHRLLSEAIEAPTKFLADGVAFLKGSSSGSSSDGDRHFRSSPSLPGLDFDITSERVERYNFSLRPSPRNGLGLFTNEDIPKGNILIIERPALILPSVHGELIKQKQANPEKAWDCIKADYLQGELERLPKPKQGEIWSLSNHTENSKEFPLLSIFRTNSFGFSEHEGLSGIYVFCARINHSCDPNCSWDISRIPESNDLRDRVIRITTIQELKTGDELTITYTTHENRVEERQTELLRAYGFKCRCPRCIFEQHNLERLYAWPSNLQQRARLRFNPVRSRHESGDSQGWDFLTTIEHISGNDATVLPGNIIAQETPLILLTKEEMEIFSSSLILERFQQLSSSRRKAYLRLYNQKFKQPAPPPSKEDSWPSYDLESTDEEVPTSGERSKFMVGPFRRRSRPLPEELLDKWSTNSFHLDHGTQAVFSFISHLEHNCLPTCKVVWSVEEQILKLVVVRPLKIGDQITICYKCKSISYLPVRERQQYLKEHYGFDCSCFRCYLDLSDVNKPAPNIDPLPLSEILAAGEEINCKSTTNSKDVERARPIIGGVLQIPSRELAADNLQPNLRDQTIRVHTSDSITPNKCQSRTDQSPFPLHGAFRGMWRNENKRSAEA